MTGHQNRDVKESVADAFEAYITEVRELKTFDKITNKNMFYDYATKSFQIKYNFI